MKKDEGNDQINSQLKPTAHRWLGFAACNFSVLECQTCGIKVKREDALAGKHPICPKPHPKGCNLYKFRSIQKGEKVLQVEV